ncbi:uncharacterized protein [Cherax quadricarinatus]|uniref:uncharacterized protein n=1 Tax=Cherax quadricarinatus TaxID=27406 RepID=UPI0023786E6B|nr:keratin, type I cytoskeletal 9-like [Cherax quadricarinatus]
MTLLVITLFVALLMGSCRPEDISKQGEAPDEKPSSIRRGGRGKVLAYHDPDGFFRGIAPEALPKTVHEIFSKGGAGHPAGKHGVHDSVKLPNSGFGKAPPSTFGIKTNSIDNAYGLKNGVPGGFVGSSGIKTNSLDSTYGLKNGVPGGFVGSSGGRHGPVGSLGHPYGGFDGSKNSIDGSFGIRGIPIDKRLGGSFRGFGKSFGSALGSIGGRGRSFGVPTGYRGYKGNAGSRGRFIGVRKGYNIPNYSFGR